MFTKKAFIAVYLVLAVAVPTFAQAQTFRRPTPTVTTFTGDVISKNGNTFNFASRDHIGIPSYTVDASRARVSTRNGERVDIVLIRPGDRVTVRGSVNGTTILASTVQDLSLQGRQTLSGTVRTVNGPTFALQVRRTGTIAVMVNSSTRITRNNRPASLSDIAPGRMVTVTGILQSSNHTLHATSVRILR